MKNDFINSPKKFLQKKLWLPDVLYRYTKTFLSYTFFLQQTFRLSFIISGIPKCGTTWFARIMASYPDTYVAMEGSPQSVERQMRDSILNNPSFDLEDKKSRIHLNRFKQFVVKRAGLSNKKILGYKIPGVLPEALKETFPDVNVLYLYRDGRDFVVSDAFHNIRMGRIQGAPQSEEFWTEAITKRAPYWANMVMDVLPRFRLLYKDNLFEVRYEDLLIPENGLGITRKALGFLQLNPVYADMAWNKNTFKRLSGGRISGREDRNSFYRKGISGDWRNYFSTNNLNLFLEIAGDGLEALGYKI